MDKNTAYNLYRKKEEFCQLLRERGFKCKDIKEHIIEIYGQNNNSLGTIFDDRILVIDTEWCERYKGDKSYNDDISRLQKLAEDFKIRD